jgi:quercetin dioxygenase-like cupin family protein
VSAPASWRGVRRVVTGHDANGIAMVLSDTRVSEAEERDGRWRTRVWATPVPGDIAAGTEIAAPAPSGPLAYAAGAQFLVFDFGPHNVINMHRTDTVDYVVVMEGEIEMDLDEGTVTLRAGDVLVQRGTNHVWRNATDRTARAAIVMIPAQPLGVSPETTRGASTTGGSDAPS